MVGSGPVADDPRRVSGDDVAGGDRPCHHRAGPDDRARSEGDTRKDKGPRSDKDIALDSDRGGLQPVAGQGADLSGLAQGSVIYAGRIHQSIEISWLGCVPACPGFPGTVRIRRYARPPVEASAIRL